MKNDSKVLDIIISKIKKEYSEDVSLLVSYGAKKQHENLGMGFYFISKTERGKTLSTQFIIEGVSYDLFSINWERLIANAALDSPQSYLLLGTKIWYVGDTEDQMRFNKLKENLEQLLHSDHMELKLNKTYEYLNECYVYLYNMKVYKDSLKSVRLEAGKLLNMIANGLAFINGTFYDGGNGTVLRDSVKLELLPEDYKTLVDSILFAKDTAYILSYSETLTANTRTLLHKIKQSEAQVEPFESMFVGYYEEIKKSLNKCRNAINEEDYYQLNELCGYIQEEVALFLTKVEQGIWYGDRNTFVEYSQVYDKYFGEDLLSVVAQKDKVALMNKINQFDEILLTLMNENNVLVRDFDSINDFENFFSRGR